MLQQKYLSKLSRLFLLLSLSFCIFSCGDEEEDPAPESAEFLVSSTDLTEFSLPDIENILAQAGITDFDGEINNPINVFKITYKTVFEGDTIEASGLVVLPVGEENVPIVCVQHGTITAESNAPSNFDALDGDLSFFELFSAGGFITFIPDFVGFGESSELLHPYFIEESYEQAVVDFIRAGVEFLDQEDVEFEERLFLFGYSEGGYATLAVQDRIENDPDLNLRPQLEAVSAGAGGYLLNLVTDSIVSEPTYPEPAFIGFIIDSYIEYTDVKGPLGRFFQDPYADRIANLVNGDNTIDEINAQLTEELDQLIQPDFLDTLRDGTQVDLRIAFEENSVADYAPRTQLRLYHSPEDEVIPIGTTLATRDSLEANGATAPVEVFTNVRGPHFEAAIQTAARTLGWFSDLK